MTMASKRRRGRPPKEATGYNETKKALIRAGLELLTEKGFSATAIDQVLRRVDIPKGSFYHYFESKEAFGAELIESYAAYFARKLVYFLEDETMKPLERIQAFAADAESGMARHGYSRGCLVGNLGQEMNVLPESYRSKLEAVFVDWQERIARCFRSAKDGGEIPEDADCERLAAVFWIGWEGAVLRAKLERSPVPLRLFLDFFFASLSR